MMVVLRAPFIPCPGQSGNPDWKCSFPLFDGTHGQQTFPFSKFFFFFFELQISNQNIDVVTTQCQSANSRVVATT